MKEIIIECNNYVGEMSEERCKTIEEFMTEKIRNNCELKKVTMKEIQIQDNLIQPTLTMLYDQGEIQSLVELIDESLTEIGITAIKIIVSKLASRLAEGLLAGGVGLVAGGKTNPVAGTLIGALVGGLVGSTVEKRITEYVATKNSGDWIIEKIKVAGKRK